MEHVTRYSPTTRLFYIGSHSALPSDAYEVTPEQVEEIVAQNAETPEDTAAAEE